MKKALFLILFISLSCAQNKLEIQPSLSSVKQAKTGALLTVDLDTKGLIKRGQNCHLVINKNDQRMLLSLKEGVFNYALPIGAGIAKLSELNCGPFYYYKLEDRGTYFEVKNGSISYLGTIDFQLKEKGEMTWGPSTKSKRLLEGHLGEMGLTGEEVVIQPLNL